MLRLSWLVLLLCWGVVACSINTEATGTGSDPDAGAAGGMGGTGGGAAGSGGGSDCFPTQAQKFCGGQNCPDKSDPSHGCATTSCAPCSVPNAIADCASDGSCDVQSCNPGFSDCDGAASDGCEVNTDADPHNCGGCGQDCFTPGDSTNWDCISGVCKVSKCPLGRGDCNQDPTDKCEIDLTSDPDNCSFCGGICAATVQHATPSCTAGKCGYSKCDPGWADCDGNRVNGCEQDVATDPTHCGSCNTVCNTTNGKAACVAGQCAITCNPGFGNCNGLASDGCETNLNTNTSHCGTCPTACSTNHATPTCSSGTCVLTCQGSWRDCNKKVSDGCEANLNTNRNHCGSCAKACSTNHATPTCSGGLCVLSCKGAYRDCNGNEPDGCEVNSATDVNHCGGCASSCSGNHGTPSCSGSSCSIQCSSGYGNCDGNPSNGCETNTTNSTNHCGACGYKCGSHVQNASGVACSGSACTYTGSCSSGFGDCTGGKADGCETPLDTTSNCKACGVPCNPAHATGTCSTGSCAIASCTAPYKDCSGGVGNGCETNTSSSANNCGACGYKCSAHVQNASGVACSGSACTYTGSCSSGFGDCTGGKADGCETALDTTTNCGVCGNNCTTNVVHASGVACGGGGTCTYTGSCSAGWDDCTGGKADGCETDLAAVTTCGSCSNDCTAKVVHASGVTCETGGTCSYTGSCAANWDDCNNDKADGCETDLTTDSDCGACGAQCVGALSCKQSGGVYSCST